MSFDFSPFGEWPSTTGSSSSKMEWGDRAMYRDWLKTARDKEVARLRAELLSAQVRLEAEEAKGDPRFKWLALAVVIFALVPLAMVVFNFHPACR